MFLLFLPANLRASFLSFLFLSILEVFVRCLRALKVCFSIFQGQNHTGTPKTSFSDTQNDVFVILASEFKGFISVFAVFFYSGEGL